MQTTERLVLSLAIWNPAQEERVPVVCEEGCLAEARPIPGFAAWVFE
jgi:hypothetical protein